jgi:hypothetical protein
LKDLDLNKTVTGKVVDQVSMTVDLDTDWQSGSRSPKIKEKMYFLLSTFYFHFYD